MRRSLGLGMPSLVGTVGIHWCFDPPRLLLLEVPPFHFLDYGRPGGAYDGRCDYVFFPGCMQSLRPHCCLSVMEPLGVMAREYQRTALTGPATWH